jgi:restriction system protein
MSNDLVEIGVAEAHLNVSGTRVLKYSVEIFHTGLNEHKLLTAPEKDILENKVGLQLKKWGDKWATQESNRKAKELKAASIQEAEARTRHAERQLEAIDNLLVHTLSVNYAIDWEQLKDTADFAEARPEEPKRNSYHSYPKEPKRIEQRFTPEFGFLDKLMSSRRERKIKHFDRLFMTALAEWRKAKERTAELNREVDAKYFADLMSWNRAVEAWAERKEQFHKKQDDYNAKIDALRKAYICVEPEAVVEYCEIVLERSKYPEGFSKSFELEYKSDTRILIVEYELPAIERFPRVKEVKYIASKKELRESTIPEAQMLRMFDGAMYRITLRSLFELFEADAANAIDAISFNGWVRAINKATGKEENNCILSVQVTKSEFMAIDLANVDPKVCFKALKGVAGSKLHSLTPVQPILQIERSDRRFVDGQNVSDEIDSGTNIAAMDWEDFEHLIRELFEKEFQSAGGEVKVTRASRDGGVDAVAFDPDPIRGGKIVIQAKRYTNTVGVSAVRDLFGTVMNEGATKGILVTTADYGPDAYDFAKGKPLTLLSGSNLLHLLEKHGQHAKIDIKEAKKLLAEVA